MYVCIYIYTDHIQIHVSIIMHAPVDDLTRLDIHLAQPRKSYNLQHWEFRYLFTAYAQASGSRTIRASRSGELSMCPRAGGKPVKTEDWNDGVEVWRIFQYFPYFIILHCFIILHQMFIISYPSLYIQRFLGARFWASKADLLKPLDPPPTGKMLEELMYSQELKILKMGTSF